MKMKVTNRLENSKILILGMGDEGLSTLHFLRNILPNKKIIIADQTPFDKFDKKTKKILVSDKNLNLFLGKDYLDRLKGVDIIFKNPAVPPPVGRIAAAKKKGCQISSNTELFFENCPGQIIGVTGTKGKSTTTSMIYEVLKAGGLDARLGGNIGIAPLELLRDPKVSANTIFVMELSSYQLLGLPFSPHIAVLQNIVREHLNYHKTFTNYVKAKETIVLHQSKNDFVIYNSNYSLPTQIAFKSLAKKMAFGLQQIAANACFIEDGFLMYRKDENREKDERIISIDKVPLLGQFNLQNVMPAIIVAKLFKIPTKILAQAIKSFKPLEHRLEFVAKINNISFYNDSLSTIPEAAIAALQTVAERKREVILIAGGFDRGQDFTELAKMILDCRVKKLILFPTTGEKIWQVIKQLAQDKKRVPPVVFVEQMMPAVQEAFRRSSPGDVVLLSPASASFSGFKDYQDRGKQFKSEVMALSAKD